MDILTQLVKGSIEFLTKPIRITDLNSDSFKQILKYLSLADLFICRGVNKYFMKNIDEYLESVRIMTYSCELNGIKMRGGEYVFNWGAFDFILSKMPNLRILRFEKCPHMFGALATCGFNIVESIAYNLVMLNQLHITRCRALNRSSFELLVDSFPNLTHLTVTIYNESYVEIITKGLTNLKYLNLDQSCLNDYGSHLTHFGPKICTFIASPDHNDHKKSIIDGLVNGNGRYLKHLELNIKIDESDNTLFDLIGQELTDLLLFKCQFDSKRVITDYAIISGLSKLSKLKVLRLEENVVMGPMHSVFDDQSILSIMKGCAQLEELTIIVAKNNKTQSKCITDSSLSLIDQLLPNLRVLILKSVDITNETLKSIEQLNNLETLRLDSLPYVTSNGLKNFISNCSHITRMDVHNCSQQIQDSSQ